MRVALLLALCGSMGFFLPQENVWQYVKIDAGPVTQLRSITLSSQQLALVRKALADRVRLDHWPCADGDEPDWVEKVTFEGLPISDTEQAVLVEAGTGCGRGAQGANGAMWVLQFKGYELSFLATPEQKFSGWLYSIQSTKSHGLRDLVVGWHMSAGEADLSYFRFDGRSYREIATAQLLFNEGRPARIVPTQIH